MATLSHADSRRMYSWWWDSHVSPKNSKWLQENLTDMDVKVKSMIKLIEEDADSFARRAEMYFKKRPELLKLVEEFYRAYRALAERYDHATGALRQAHRTIAEAFPNQVPLGLADDAPLEAECFATERRPTLSDSEELQKDSFGGSLSHLHAVQRSGTVIDEADSATSKKGLKQLNDLFGSDEAAQRRPKSAEGRARRGLNFKEAEEARPASSCEPVCRSEREIQALKDALSKLEAEKDANFSRYDQSLERLSNLESEVSRAQDDSKGINDKASNAEAEVQALKESLGRLEAEREAGRIEYQLCIERIQNLENTLSRAQQDAGELNQRASKAETEIQALKNELSRLEAEKDALLIQYKESLDLISNLENKLLHAEERARRIHEQAGTAESEVGNLKHALALLSDEKDASVLQCQQNKDKISSLEDELSCSQEETKWLKGEKESGIAKLKDTEEQYHLLEKSNHYLQSDLESMVLKMGEQNQELIEKQKEVGRLWAYLQEERLRFMEAETAFQNLQHMHSHSQEELRSLTAELQKAVQILKDMEAHNHSLQDKIQKLIEENKNLSEINLSSAESMDNMKDQMSKLRHIKLQLEEEVGLRVDQRNALQQEIYCLKEELSDLNKKLYALIEQIKSVGLQPESVGSSVKELQDKSSKLREVIEKESSEKASLSEKLEIMESILEKNKVLENSLSDLSAELDGFRGKAKALEESCEFLVGEKLALISEKEALVSQLQSMRQNYDNLSEKSGLLENSLSDAHAELEGLREKLKSVENFCELLGNEKFGLLSERDSLASKFEITQQRLEDLENRYTHLEDRHSCLESDKESVLQKLEELTVSLDSEKHKHSKFAESSEARLAGLETQVRVLQEDTWTRKKEIEEGIDKAVNAQIEIFILQKCIQDLEERNYSLLIDCEKFFRLSKYSEKLISDLQKENLEQRIEAKDLNGLIKKLRMGISQIYKALELDSDYGATYEKGEEQLILNHALLKLQDARACLSNFQDENQKLVIEKSVYATVFVQLEMDAANLQEEKNMTDQELRIIAEQLSVLQSETHKLSIMNENLTLKSQEQEQKEKMLTASIEDLNGKLSLLEEAYQDMETENAIKTEEKTYLMTKLLNAMEQNHSLKEENSAIFDEAFSQSNLSMILMTSVVEKTEQQRELCVNLDKFQGINNTLGDRVDVLDRDLETSKLENLFLKELLDKSEKLLQTEKLVSDLLKFEVARKNDLLYQKGVDLLEAEQKLTAIEIERFLWVNTIKELKTKFDELEETREDKKKQILRLAQDNVHWGDQNEGLHEEIRRLNNDLQSLHNEREAAKAKEERLYSDLRKERNEVELWQNEAATFFGELQVSAVREAMFEEKINELRKICERFQDQIISKDTEIDLLNGRARTLEDETGGLKSQLDLFMPAFAALNEGLTSLESRTLMYAKSNSTKDVAVKDTNASYPDAEPCQKLVEDQIPRAPYGFPDVQSRIVAVEKAVTEMEKAAEKEILTANMKLEAAMRHIEELQSRKNWNYGNAQTKNHGASDDLKLSKPLPEIWEAANELLTKDIMLDQMSEGSSYWTTKRDGGRAASQSSDLWDTVDRNDSIALEVRKLKNTNAEPTGKHQIKTVEEHKAEHPYPGVMAEKELGVDLLEISRSFREQSQGGNKRKILERLASDAQKLTNLDITVQDLKRKVELNEKSKKEIGIEYDTVKVQLEEAEEAIQKLFDSNGKLAKIVQDKVLPSGKSGMELEEGGSARRRRISEQARRGSEKIGRLQVEVQQLQFLLLKLDDETEKKAKIRVPERKTRVLLRDYLYGGLRPKSKQKKSHCCSCVQPPTRGD